jgi:hypothetical protein
MRIVVRCDLEEFKRYYRTLDDLHDHSKTLGLTARANLGWPVSTKDNRFEAPLKIEKNPDGSITLRKA